MNHQLLYDTLKGGLSLRPFGKAPWLLLFLGAFVWLPFFFPTVSTSQVQAARLKEEAHLTYEDNYAAHTRTFQVITNFHDTDYYGPCLYEWQETTDGGASFHTLRTTTENTLTIPLADKTMSHAYRCIVHSSYTVHNVIHDAYLTYFQRNAELEGFIYWDQYIPSHQSVDIIRKILRYDRYDPQIVDALIALYEEDPCELVYPTFLVVTSAEFAKKSYENHLTPQVFTKQMYQFLLDREPSHMEIAEAVKVYQTFAGEGSIYQYQGFPLHAGYIAMAISVSQKVSRTNPAFLRERYSYYDGMFQVDQTSSLTPFMVVTPPCSIPTFSLSLDATEGILGLSGEGRYAPGTKVSVHATIKPMDSEKIHHFLGWEGTFSSPEEEFTFTMPWGAVRLRATTKTILRNRTITWDGNGGSVPISSSPATYLAPIGPMPLPTRADAVFLGWFESPHTCIHTREDSESQITLPADQVFEDTIYQWMDDRTFYAAWVDVGIPIITVIPEGDPTGDPEGDPTGNPSEVPSSGDPTGASTVHTTPWKNTVHNLSITCKDTGFSGLSGLRITCLTTGEVLTEKLYQPATHEEIHMNLTIGDPGTKAYEGIYEFEIQAWDDTGNESRMELITRLDYHAPLLLENTGLNAVKDLGEHTYLAWGKEGNITLTAADETLPQVIPSEVSSFTLTFSNTSSTAAVLLTGKPQPEDPATYVLSYDIKKAPNPVDSELGYLVLLKDLAGNETRLLLYSLPGMNARLHRIVPVDNFVTSS
ncbi:MAG: hypothetical protein K6C69_03335 [Lachnospiraceae bacterium]|nr:hypothetical protein [Lachnospiraceae bacterium]